MTLLLFAPTLSTIITAEILLFSFGLLIWQGMLGIGL